MRKRLDQILVERGLAPTRARARDLVLRGTVTVDGVSAGKPGQPVGDDQAVAVLEEGGKHYVSRGALKLVAALDRFSLDPAGLVCLDIGASSGGFTQVLLERGARQVVAVDVGRDQLHPSLRNDPRVTVLEGTDARSLTRDQLVDVPQCIVADASFIGLAKVLPVALLLAEPGAWLVALVKPQFELGPDAIGKGGIVKADIDPYDAVRPVKTFLEAQNWQVLGDMASPIVGKDGNREFLMAARRR